MAKIIAGQNAKVLREKENQKKECNCTKNKTCPLDKKCQTKNLIYQATVKKPNNEKSFYIGLTSTDFKKRLGVNHQSFKDPETNQTSLSKQIWKLRSQGIEPEMTWKLIDRGNHTHKSKMFANFALRKIFTSFTDPKGQKGDFQ